MGKRAYSPERRGFLHIVANAMSIMWVASLLLLSVSFAGCTSQHSEGFALYLLAEEVEPSEVTATSHLQLAESPIIATTNIISYSKAGHTMELNPEALTRIQ